MPTLRTFSLLCLTLALLGACVLGACGRPGPPAGAARTFREDAAFLASKGEVIVLRGADGAVAAVSPAYQGRVMTSAVAEDAPGFGWINRDFIAAGRTGTTFDNYGGEDRFWLGPEGGQYGLYFAPGKPFTFEHWQVPAALQEGAWAVAAQTDTSVAFSQAMTLANYGGAAFRMRVDRTVRLVGPEAAAAALGISLAPGVRLAAYETENRVTNTGAEAWRAETGLPSIWILSMYEPFDTSYVVIPFRRDAEGAAAINDAYFGRIAPARLSVQDSFLVFLADGQARGKLGIGPASARPVMGGYAPGPGALTLVQYTLPEAPSRYVNSAWEQQSEPYGGDVVNSYNDGPVAPGAAALGGFYELESSSPALALAPGEAYTHRHRTLHLVGPPEALDRIAETVLGVRLSRAAALLN